MVYNTEQLFLTFPYSFQAKSKYQKRENNYLALERSIAFPENEKIQGDKGSIIFNTNNNYDNKIFKFEKTKILDNEILIKISEEDFLAIEKEGEILIKVDIQNRAMLSISNTISKLILSAVAEIRPHILKHEQDYKIFHDKGKLDIQVEKLNLSEILYMEDFIKNMLINRKQIDIVKSRDSNQMFFWKLNHIKLQSKALILDELYEAAQVKIKRKSVSKDFENIHYELTNFYLEPFIDKFDYTIV